MPPTPTRPLPTPSPVPLRHGAAPPSFPFRSPSPLIWRTAACRATTSAPPPSPSAHGRRLARPRRVSPRRSPPPPGRRSAGQDGEERRYVHDYSVFFPPRSRPRTPGCLLPVSIAKERSVLSAAAGDLTRSSARGHAFPCSASLNWASALCSTCRLVAL